MKQKNSPHNFAISDDVKLNEFDKNEWFDVYRMFKPDATFDEYEEAWASFQQAKAAHEAEKRLQ